MVKKMNKLYNFFDKILDLVFPKKCMVCKEIFDFNETSIGVCDDCIKIFKAPTGTTCKQCGKETEQEYCDICTKYLSGKLYKDNTFYFTKNYPIFIYNDSTKISIFELKYSKNLSVLKGFEKIINQRLKDLDFSKIDLIIPVPMYIKKERKRGFNQAKLFAKLVSNLTKINYNDKALIRHRKTTVQSDKTLSMRYANLENCFSVTDKNSIKNKTILLIDDIYTSGSTINMCAKTLIENGANEVFSLSISITNEKFDDNFEV